MSAAQFDRLAPHYRWMESLLAGRKLQRCRTAFLREIPPPRRVLLAGEGNGRCLIELLRAHPDAHCTCMDASGRMLAIARERLRASGLHDRAVEFIHADLREAPLLGAHYDLLVTHFFLDCFPSDQLARLIPRLAAAAEPGANWLLADFCEPASGFRKWRARALLRAMYFFFHHTTRLPARRLTPPDPFPSSAGYRLRERRSSEWGLLHTDLWSIG
jgi:ubiquinone/menaquinone biosynthesis C-methylase UbiE